MSARVNVKVNGRPRVVIDAEDREQVERLARLLWPHYSKSESARLAKADITQAALRSLVAPEKPPEPPALFAQVEDSAGRIWWRSAEQSSVWRPLFRSRDGRYVIPSDPPRSWHEIAAVRVLSEGVRNE